MLIQFSSASICRCSNQVYSTAFFKYHSFRQLFTMLFFDRVLLSHPTTAPALLRGTLERVCRLNFHWFAQGMQHCFNKDRSASAPALLSGSGCAPKDFLNSSVRRLSSSHWKASSLRAANHAWCSRRQQVICISCPSMFSQPFATV